MVSMHAPKRKEALHEPAKIVLVLVLLLVLDLLQFMALKRDSRIIDTLSMNLLIFRVFRRESFAPIRLPTLSLMLEVGSWKFDVRRWLSLHEPFRFMAPIHAQSRKTTSHEPLTQLLELSRISRQRLECGAFPRFLARPNTRGLWS